MKYVIISIDYPSLYWGFDETRDFFYYHYYGINIRNKSYFNQNLSYFFYVFSPTPAVKVLLNKSDDFFVNGDSFVNGWSGYDSTNYTSLTENRGKEKAELFNDQIKNSKENEYVCSDLESLIYILKKKNIVPILVSAPCYKYITDYFNNKILGKNLLYINKLKEKYNLVYLNSLKDTSFKAEHFYDNDHLNKYGAAKFSILINSLISDLK